MLLSIKDTLIITSWKLYSTKLSGDALVQLSGGFVVATSEVTGIEDNNWFVADPSGDKGLTLTIQLRLAISINKLTAIELWPEDSSTLAAFLREPAKCFRLTAATPERAVGFTQEQTNLKPSRVQAGSEIRVSLKISDVGVLSNQQICGDTVAKSPESPGSQRFCRT